MSFIIRPLSDARRLETCPSILDEYRLTASYSLIILPGPIVLSINSKRLGKHRRRPSVANDSINGQLCMNRRLVT